MSGAGLSRISPHRPGFDAIGLWGVTHSVVGGNNVSGFATDPDPKLPHLREKRPD